MLGCCNGQQDSQGQLDSSWMLTVLVMCQHDLLLVCWVAKVALLLWVSVIKLRAWHEIGFLCKWQTCYCRNCRSEETFDTSPVVISTFNGFSSRFMYYGDVELWSVVVALNTKAPAHYGSVVTHPTGSSMEATVEQYYLMTIKSWSPPDSGSFFHSSTLIWQGVTRTDTPAGKNCINKFVILSVHIFALSVILSELISVHVHNHYGNCEQIF